MGSEQSAEERGVLSELLQVRRVGGETMAGKIMTQAGEIVSQAGETMTMAGETNSPDRADRTCTTNTPPYVILTNPSCRSNSRLENDIHEMWDLQCALGSDQKYIKISDETYCKEFRFLRNAYQNDKEILHCRLERIGDVWNPLTDGSDGKVSPCAIHREHCVWTACVGCVCALSFVHAV